MLLIQCLLRGVAVIQRPVARRHHLGQPEVENLGVAALRHKNVGRLDVPMNDALRVRRLQCVGNVDGERQQRLGIHWTASHPVFQRQSVQKLHGDERLSVVLTNFVNRADVRVVQGRRRAGFPAEAFQRLRILREALRQKLQGDKAAQLGVFRLVDDTHATATELLDDAVVRNGLADHWRGILRISSWQVNESQRVGGKSKGWLAQNRVSDNVGGVKQFSSTLQNALKRRAPFRSS